MLPFPFSELPAKSCKEIYVERGEAIFNEGAKTRGMIFVLSGCIELRCYTESGSAIVIHTAKAENTFVEAALFSEHYHCDAIAISNSRVTELSKLGIFELFNSNIEFATMLTQRFARQIQEYRRKVESLAIRNANDRVYFGLAEGLLQTDIKSFASEIGLTHEVVYRSLNKLIKLGKIEKGEVSHSLSRITEEYS